MKYFKLSRFFGTAFCVLSLLETNSALAMLPSNNEKSGIGSVLDKPLFGTSAGTSKALDKALGMDISKIIEENQKQIARIRGVESIIKILKEHEKNIEIVVSQDYGREFDGLIYDYREQYSKGANIEGKNMQLWRHGQRSIGAKRWRQKLAEMLYDEGLDNNQVTKKLENNNLIFKISKNGKCEFEFVNS